MSYTNNVYHLISSPMFAATTVRDSYKPYSSGTVWGMDWRKRMEDRRNLVGLTQAQVAEALGISLAAYGHYAHGRREPDLETFERIAAALGCAPSWLLFGVDKPSDQRAAHVLEVMEQLPEFQLEVLSDVADGLLRKKAAREN